MAWVASTRGIASVARDFGVRKIRELDLILLCQEIMEYLQNTSKDPKKRLSLRLSTYLIQGTIKLHLQQTIILQANRHRLNVSTFITPPTPIIQAKRKRVSKKRDVASDLEQFIHIREEEVAATVGPAEIGEIFLKPSESQLRQITLLEEPAQIRTALPEELFGELGVEPITEVPSVRLPWKGSQDGSDKSQLELIEEKLIAEEKLSGEEKRKMLFGTLKRRRSSSADEPPQKITVTAQVHRTAEEEVPLRTTVELQPIKQPRVSQVIEEIRVAEELEPPRIVEKLVSRKEEEIVSEIEKLEEQVKVTPVKATRRKKIAEKITVPETPSVEDESEASRKKKELIAKRLQIKFKTPKRILRLNDEDKQFKPKEQIDINIFNEVKLLVGDFRDFIMKKTSIEQVEGPFEDIRRDKPSSSIGSDLRLSKITPLTSTPQEKSSLPLGTIESAPILHTGDFMTTAIQSTPFRELIELPPRKLYEDAGPLLTVPEKEKLLSQERELESIIEQTLMQKEQLALQEAQLQFEEITIKQKLPKDIPKETAESSESSEEYKLTKETETRKSVTVPSVEEVTRRQMIIQRVKLWDPSQGYLTLDLLIPIPQNRLNAARTFFDLLELAKDGYVKLIPEETTLEIISVEKGHLLLF
ncbi:hypothetical protein HHI36_004107 [Cryptolaemus montrouzieri]|uniref:Rad21/Rec8-like protein N-terminal domain-containing protein n=1 Tax=Cryptolaemus montrouzieri TaxID=559131 RepID=A0ABD2NQL3_9CUCU